MYLFTLLPETDVPWASETNHQSSQEGELSTQLKFTCSKSVIEILEKSVKYVQSKQ